MFVHISEGICLGKSTYMYVCTYAYKSEWNNECSKMRNGEKGKSEINEECI